MSSACVLLRQLNVFALFWLSSLMLNFLESVDFDDYAKDVELDDGVLCRCLCR